MHFSHGAPEGWSMLDGRTESMVSAPHSNYESKVHIRASKFFQSFTCASMLQRACAKIKGMEEGSVIDADGRSASMLRLRCSRHHSRR